MRSVELFSGAGGLALGLHLAGFQHELLVESDKDAVETLTINQTQRTVLGIQEWNVQHSRVEDILDAGDLDRGDIDLLAAGIPCQPFSRAGKHRGHADDRNMLPVFARVLSRMRPKAFLLENVDGLAKANETVEYAKMQLSHPNITSEGDEAQKTHLQKLLQYATTTEPLYTVHLVVINAADYGVPQSRKRVFLIGFRTDLTVDWNFPNRNYSRAALLYDQCVTGQYWRRHNIPQPKRFTPATNTLNRLIECSNTKPWRTIRDAIVEMPIPARGKVGPSGWQWHTAIPRARLYPGHTGSPIDRPSKTIKAGVHGVPGGENILVHPNQTFRYLTLRECATIQTFPKQWLFAGLRASVTRQIGNAVPVELAAIIGISIKESLQYHQMGTSQVAEKLRLTLAQSSV